MIEFRGQMYFDDRLFVIEVCRMTVAGEGEKSSDIREWAVITRQNVEGYPALRCDGFRSMEEASIYARRIATSTPRASLGGQVPDPEPTIEEFRQWLDANGLHERHISGFD